MQKNITTILISVVASVVVSSVIALAVSGNKSGESSNVNQAIENYLATNPMKIRDALQLAAQQEQAEAQKRIAEAYKKYIDELNNDEGSPFVGPKDAKVTIVEFFDFNCGYCKRLAPTMEKLIKANPDVKFVFKPVTFLGSMPIAKAAIAAHKQGKFLEVYNALLTHNGQLTTEVVNEKLEEVGLDIEKTKEIMDSDEVKNSLAKIATLSNNVQLRGVPTLVINGTALQFTDEKQVQAAIDELK